MRNHDRIDLLVAVAVNGLALATDMTDAVAQNRIGQNANPLHLDEAGRVTYVRDGERRAHARAIVQGFSHVYTSAVKKSGSVTLGNMPAPRRRRNRKPLNRGNRSEKQGSPDAGVHPAGAREAGLSPWGFIG